jgi:hypothetical protein
VNAYIEKLQTILSAARFIAEPHISVDDRGKSCSCGQMCILPMGRCCTFANCGLAAASGKRRPNLSTAPHHKHAGKHDVVAATSPDVQQVLNEIEAILDAQSPN